MKYLYPNQIRYLHQQIVQMSGGKAGLRDEGLLESAVYRPQSGFGGHEAYPDLLGKVAVLGYSLIHNHPFVDGNKRIGYAAMRLMLRMNDHDIVASENVKYAFVMKIAEGKLTEQGVVDWLTRHTKRK